MESDLSGLTDGNELCLHAQMGRNARGFHLRRKFSRSGTQEVEGKWKQTIR